jgi:hypothetical protein
MDDAMSRAIGRRAKCGSASRRVSRISAVSGRRQHRCVRLFRPDVHRPPYSGAASLFEAFGIDGKHSATVAALIGIGSRDELEGMMAAQFDRRSQRFDGVLPARHDR